MKIKMQSFSNPNHWYTIVIRQKDGKTVKSCSCPAWIYSRERKPCKHIKAAEKGFPNFKKEWYEIVEA